MLIRFLGVGLLLGGLLAGCATNAPMSDEEVVTKKAQSWIDALLAHDYDAAYNFTAPGFKSRVSTRSYQKRYAGSGSWVKGWVDSIACKDSSCEVTVKITYRIKGTEVTANTVMKDTWVHVDRQWWLYHKK